MRYRPFTVHADALLLAIRELRTHPPGTRMAVAGGKMVEGAFMPRRVHLEIALLEHEQEEFLQFEVLIGEDP